MVGTHLPKSPPSLGPRAISLGVELPTNQGWRGEALSFQRLPQATSPSLFLDIHLPWDGANLNVNICSQRKMISSDVSWFSKCAMLHRRQHVTSRIRNELFSKSLWAPDLSEGEDAHGHLLTGQAAGPPWSVARSSAQGAKAHWGPYLLHPDFSLDSTEPVSSSLKES